MGTQQHHPENKPDVIPLQRFTINLGNFNQAETDVELEYDAIDTRIGKFNTECTLSDIPVIRQILSMADNPNEVRKLGLALERISKMLDRYEELGKLKTFIEMAKDKPNVLVAALGDFTEELTDEATSLFFDDIE